MARIAVRLAIAAAALALASPAGAATLSTAGGVLTYAPAEAKSSVVSFEQPAPGTVRVTAMDSAGNTDAVGVAVGSTCTPIAADPSGNPRWDCTGITSVVASGADMYDSLSAQTLSVPVQFDGGSGLGILNGGNAADTLQGGPDIDVIGGGDGIDTIRGGGGPDQLTGGPGADEIHGDLGDDSLNGEAGADKVFGGEGRDFLTGGTGTDTIEGGPGDDAVQPVAEGEADDVRGGPGIDSLVVCVGGIMDFANPTATNPNQQVSLDDVANDGFLGETDNVHSDIEDLEKCLPQPGFIIIPAKLEGREFLTGSALMNSLAGNQNDDQITGGDGNDFLFGNDGNDALDTRDGFADRADCGGGTADTARVDTFDQVKECETVDSAEVAPRGPGTDQVPTADDKPPTVAFTAPASGATLSTAAPNVLAATATDDKGVTQVVFLAGERVLCTVTAAPYTCAFSPLDSDVGKAVLEVIAYDAAQQTAVAVRGVKVPRFTPALSARTTPKRDAISPYRFTTKGKLTLPQGVTTATGCSGTVAVVFKAGKKTISTRRVSVRKDCTYSSKVSFSIPSRLKPKTLRVGVTYRGNAVLLPATAKAATVRTR